MTLEQSAPLQLWQITDTHCHASDDTLLMWSPEPIYTNRALLRVLQHLKQQPSPPAALILSGDIVQEETAAGYARAQALLANCDLPVYCLPGNHDVPELLRAHLLNEQLRWQDQYVVGNWHCLFLDSSHPKRSDGHLEPAQLEALHAQLAALGSDQHVLIFMHHQPIAISPWLDRMSLQNPAAFWSVLEDFPQVKVVAFGHIHHHFASTYQTARGHRIALYGTPATCVQLEPEGTHLRIASTQPGWRTFTLYPDGHLDTQVEYLSA